MIQEGKVVNVCLWDGLSNWTPPEGTTLVELKDDEQVDTRDIYVDNKFERVPQEVKPAPTIEEKLKAIGITTEELKIALAK